MNNEDISAAAKALGMASNEVLEVVDSSVGTLVQTIDGQFTVIGDDGSLAMLVKPTPTYGGDFPVLYPDLSVDDALVAVGVDPDEISEPEPRPATATVEEGASEEVANAASPGDLEASADALVEGPRAPAPDPEATGEAVPDGTDLGATGEVVPDGTASEIEAWVGEDPDRAAQALAVERGRDKPRKGLTEHLEGLVED